MGVSVTHLGHAATVVAASKSSEVGNRPLGDRLVCPLFFNGRRYLEPDNSKQYLPMCRAMGFVEFHGLETLFPPKQPSQAETYKALIHACYQARDSYQRIHDQTSVLSESFAGSEYLASTKDEVYSTRARPLFINDGVTEQYIQQFYGDVSPKHAVFTVLGVEFVADPAGPALVIRISTFRGQLRLSAEWNDACYRREEIESFAREVYQLMQLMT